jgi:hypothetical protein
MNAEMETCIANCMECYRVCRHMMVHCLKKGGAHAAPDHQTLLADCAEICRTSADFMIRMSPRHHLTCGACAEVCAACAQDCERLADDDAMRRCAEVCRRCADSCRRMSKAA